jgi:hypothetical protein
MMIHLKEGFRNSMLVFFPFFLIGPRQGLANINVTLSIGDDDDSPILSYVCDVNGMTENHDDSVFYLAFTNRRE